MANLLRNAGFEDLDSKGVPMDWYLKAPREALQVKFEVVEGKGFGGRRAVKMSSDGNQGCFGIFGQICEGIDPKQGYRFSVHFTTERVASIQDSVRPVLAWRKSGGTILATDYVTEFKKEGEGFIAEKIFKPWPEAASVDICLVFRWSQNGAVLWSSPQLVENAPLERQWVKVSTVSLRVPSGATPDQCVEECCRMLERAGEQGSDIVCLTEGVLGGVETAQPIPGPAFSRMAEVARKYKMYVIANFYEKDGNLFYNTAFLIDRQGRLIGKYRKVHITEGEAFAGVTPGSSIPVFETDFGKIGITICYDNKFPEVHRIMALKGAQIIFSSSEGDGREGGYTQDIVARARAVNNGVYVVAAGRCMENTGQPHWWRGDGTFIVSPEGYILASSGKQSTEVITREIDLGRSMLGAVTYAGVEAWSDVWREARRPHLYNYLSKY